ncbi:hypothetical protein Ptr902_03251 [Pyrenophora tritici-repentis]|nr:hypothetical protein Ptr902_03251 [Pyrenophora tritici-repentis]
MPGTFQEDAERPPGESCGSESSNTGSFVAQVATRFNRSIAPLNMDDDTKLSAEKPHPFSFRFATAVDIKKTWEEIEVKKTRLQGFDALQIMSDLSLLEHAHISKEAILSCPIMDQVRDLQIHPNEKIAAKASVVLPRLESIISPKQDPQPEPTSNEGFWEKMIRHSGPSISTSQNIFDTPTLFRGGALGHAVSAVTSAQLPHIPPVPPSSGMPDTLARTKSPSLFSGFAGTSEKLPVRSTNPLPKLDAFAQTTSQSPACSSLFPSTNTEKVCLFGSRYGATDKDLFPSFRLERQTEQSASQLTSPGFLFGHRNDQSTSNGFLFGHENDARKQQGLFGSFIPSPGSVLAPKAMEQRSSVKSTIPDKDATSGLFGKTASDVSKPSDAKTPLDVWAKPDINTYEDLVEYLNTSIELDERDIPLWRDDLGRLWKEVTSVINELYSNGSKDGKSLDKHQRNKEQSRSTLVGSMCVTLRKLLAVDEQNIAKQQTRMDEIKGGMQAMKSKLVSTEESLKNYSIKLSTIGEQLKKAEKLLKELEEENIELKKREKDIDRIMEEHAASLKEVCAQTFQDVNSKSLELAKATKEVEHVQRQLKSLEQENQDLSLTKLTLGKKCEDLKVEVESLKSYEQGYIQIKQQLEELQTSSSTSTSAAPRRDNQNHTADTDRLDLVVNFWEKALKEKLASNDKTKTQISALDAEIEKAQQALSLRLAPTTPAPTAPALATSIAPTALDVPPTPIFYKRGLLETGMEPFPRIRDSPATRVVPNPDRSWAGVVKRGLGNE